MWGFLFCFFQLQQNRKEIICAQTAGEEQRGITVTSNQQQNKKINNVGCGHTVIWHVTLHGPRLWHGNYNPLKIHLKD